MKSSIDRLENLVRVSLEGNHDSSTTVRVVFANRRIDGRSLHGTQCGTAALVERGIHGGQDAALCPKADVPSLLVEVEVLCIKLVKEVRVADVQLVGCDTDNWA
jgi:hypothetical protein